MKTIKKSIVIHASNQKVWNVLIKNEYNKQWFAEFSEGSHAQTDWQVGSKAIFTDTTGGGLIARITENKLNQLLSMEYIGIMVNGKEDYGSAEAKKYNGGKEIYVL
ncbi:MAG: SRPBCC domain-containing protein [Bacteroidetes bacterium]|nr:SRPBCC domain-containing protein [Bacteroidota bacterium]